MEINRYIDHTLLKRDATLNEVDAFINDAKKFNFKTICIHPLWVEYAKKQLKGTEVGITTVIGFPYGSQTVESKLFEAKDAIKKGADELDFVITVSKVHDKDEKYLREELQKIRKLTKGRIIKLILETGLLTKNEIVYIAELAIEYDFDFIKTSTGIQTTGATVEDVKLMKEIANKKNKEVKASGGVRSKEDAMKMLEAGATRIGTSNGVDIMNNKVSKNDY